MGSFWSFGKQDPVSANEGASAKEQYLDEKIAQLEREHAEQVAALEARLADADKAVARLTRFKENLGNQVDELGERLALSESVIANLPEPLVITDLSSVVSYLNDAAVRACGKRREDAVGKLREAELWDTGGDTGSLIDRCLRSAKPIIDVPREVVTRDGSTHYLLVTAAPRRTSLGEIKGAFAIYRDHTETAHLTSELVNSGERVRDVHTSAAEILAASREQVASASEQATTVAEVSTTATELAASAGEVADACALIADSIATLQKTAHEGQGIVEQSVANLVRLQQMTNEAGQQIAGLGERIRRIEGIVDLISTVAAETKLIAFNAAIEAARAGDVGRGFAVVASEVKSLAESVAASSTEIRSMVGDIRGSTSNAILSAEGQWKLMDQVVELSNRSAAAFREIVLAIEAVSGRSRGITSSSHQQKVATEQLTIAMSEMSRAANLSATSAQQTITAVSLLTDFAKDLDDALQRFKQER